MSQNPLSARKFKANATVPDVACEIGTAISWRERLAPVWLEETLPTLKRPLTSDAWSEVGVR